jgi:hypothetical protein
MAKLIVTRPRLGRLSEPKQSFDLVLDGESVVPIALGATIEIERPPGPHRLTARVAGVRSQPIVVELGPDQTHRLAVGPNLGLSKLFRRITALAFIPFLGLAAWILYGAASLLSSGTGSAKVNVVAPAEWQLALLIPTVFIAVIPLFALILLMWNHALVLVEIPNPDFTEDQAAELLRARPCRMRVSIRQMMIAVAVLALTFWASVELSRFTRASSFRRQAAFYADMETMFREFERNRVKSDLDMEKQGFGRGHFKNEVARTKAMADYYAALRRKYEQAAASRVLRIEPDPPPPPWP